MHSLVVVFCTKKNVLLKVELNTIKQTNKLIRNKHYDLSIFQWQGPVKEEMKKVITNNYKGDNGTDVITLGINAVFMQVQCTLYISNLIKI